MTVFFEIARLKSFVVTMIIKVLLVSLILFIDTDSGFTLSKLLLMVLAYTLVSIYVGISNAVGNWYIGIFVSIGVIIIACLLMDKLPEFLSTLLVIVFIVAGPVLDISRIVRLIKLTKLKNSSQLETASTAQQETIE